MRPGAISHLSVLAAALCASGAACGGPVSQRPPSAPPVTGITAAAGGCALSAMLGVERVSVDCAGDECVCARDGVAIGACDGQTAACEVHTLSSGLGVGCCEFPEQAASPPGGVDPGISDAGAGAPAPADAGAPAPADAGAPSPAGAGVSPAGGTDASIPPPSTPSSFGDCDVSAQSGPNTVEVHCHGGVCRCVVGGTRVSTCAETANMCNADARSGAPAIAVCCNG